MRTLKVDIAIVGAGIAGLWLANLLLHRGLNVVVCERSHVGGTQTLASQGLIHGGVKYALSGSASRAFEAIAEMPRRWRDCLAGIGEVDLGGVSVVSQCYYLWSRATFGARLQGFLASKILRGRVEQLAPADFPIPFAGHAGTLYRLDDFVIDVRALVAHLTAPLADRVLAVEIKPDDIVLDQGRVCALDNTEVRIEAERFVLAAGSGNEALATAAGAKTRMQRRPLKQVLVHFSNPEANPEASPEPIFAHCITGLGTEPALTVTTHARHHYLGGALASAGCERDDADQIAAAKKALDDSMPWIDWSKRSFETLSIDRAEPAQTGGRRPDEAFVETHENILVVWPTKLALAPDLGDRVMRALA